MNRASTNLLSAAILLIAGAGVPQGRADDFRVEEGYNSLFNGKDLTGWRYTAMPKISLAGLTETPDQRIAVENGVIVMRAADKNGKGGIKDLYTIRNFPKSFHLKLEFRAGLKADSGVYLRGPQLQIRDFIRRNEHKHLKKFQTDGWNDLDVTVKQMTNGAVADCLCNGEKLQTMRNLPVTGGIGLQAESGKFEFRHVRIKELP